MFKVPELHYSVGLPRLNTETGLLVYDKNLLKQSVLNSWIRSFPNRLGVRAGEQLKDLNGFPVFVHQVLKKIEGRGVNDLQIVALGGGSVGDAVGFLASVLKRGRSLVHVPTTWLSAIDSAHGGKTALNCGVYKNQVGSFYAPKSIYMSKKILATEPSSHWKSAYGEVFKTVLIHGGSLAESVFRWNKLSINRLWKVLPELVDSKYKIVKKDPLENRGYRHILNFGHSFGHVLELSFGLAHGEAVLFGLEFALNWSVERGLLSEAIRDRIVGRSLYRPSRPGRLSRKKCKALLLQDKKMATTQRIQFIFLTGMGRCKIELVSVEEVLAEVQRQGWLRD